MEIIKNFIFPKKCVGCGQWGQYFCPDCLNYLPFLKETICPLCAKPSFYGLAHLGCLRKSPFSLDGLLSAFSYKGIIKKALIKLKYHFITDLAEGILELMISFLPENSVFYQLCCQKNVLLISLPLTKKRYNWRGFNQTELLTELLARNLNLPFTANLLVKIKETKPQAKLKKEERKKNIQKAFALNQFIKKKEVKKIQQKFSQILLFDDIWTTGATLKEAAKVLKKNGFEKVWGLTLARQP